MAVTPRGTGSTPGSGPVEIGLTGARVALDLPAVGDYSVFGQDPDRRSRKTAATKARMATATATPESSMTPAFWRWLQNRSHGTDHSNLHDQIQYLLMWGDDAVGHWLTVQVIPQVSKEDRRRKLSATSSL